MVKKYLALILVALVINLSMSGAIFAETKAEKETKFTEKVKSAVAKLGTGKDAKVQVKLKDGIKIKGYVSQINESSFTVVDEKAGTTTEVSYPNAKQVKGSNNSRNVKLFLAIAIVVTGVLVIAAIVGATSSD